MPRTRINRFASTEERLAYERQRREHARETGGRGRGGKEKVLGIEIGLDVILENLPPDVQLSRQEIAEICGCTNAHIANIESTALRKLRAQLDMHPELGEFFSYYFSERRAAQVRVAQG